MSFTPEELRQLRLADQAEEEAPALAATAGLSEVHWPQLDRCPACGWWKATRSGGGPKGAPYRYVACDGCGEIRRQYPRMFEVVRPGDTRSTFVPATVRPDR